MAELVFFRRGEEVLRVQLEERVVLGRGEKCDVVIPDPEVSRQQVALTLSGSVCRMEDLSGKGTLLGGHRLADGDVADGADLTLGQWRAVFRARSSTDASEATELGNRTELVAAAEAQGAGRLAAQVRVRRGSQEAAHRLQADTFTVGKDSANDLSLDHRFVSGRHLKVTRHDNRFQIIDLHSTNGTWLPGGIRLFEAEVPFFTTVRLGETELTIEPWASSTSSGTVTNYEGIIGNDPAVKQMAEVIERVAPSSAAVAVLGESGTGKELVARAIHTRSARPTGPFIPVNCAAISRELIESELFGHEKGAFTGATNTRKGAFEEADGGTLFLDEIGELSLELQSKLLRALESGEVKRVGASKPVHVDVRVVAATNRDLLSAAKKGAFREDLYYRLCVIPLHLPPLRNRRGDIPHLVDFFVTKFSPKGQKVRVTPDALERLQRHDWPGNVRELRNVLHRALLLRRGPNIEAADLAFDVSTGEAAKADYGQGTLEQLLAKAERQIIEAALDRCGGNRERASKELGVARSTLFKRLKEWGLTAPGDAD